MFSKDIWGQDWRSHFLGLGDELGGAAAACRHRKDLPLRPFKVRGFDGFHMVPHDSTILQYFPRDETLDDSKFAMICICDSAWFSKILEGSLRTTQLLCSRVLEDAKRIHVCSKWLHRAPHDGILLVCVSRDVGILGLRERMRKNENRGTSHGNPAFPTLPPLLSFSYNSLCFRVRKKTDAVLLFCQWVLQL